MMRRAILQNAAWVEFPPDVPRAARAAIWVIWQKILKIPIPKSAFSKITRFELRARSSDENGSSQPYISVKCQIYHASRFYIQETELFKISNF